MGINGYRPAGMTKVAILISQSEFLLVRVEQFKKKSDF